MLRSFLILLLFGCGSTLGARDLQFGVTPVNGQSRAEADWAPLTAYLSQVLGQPVALHVSKDYGSLRAELESGSVDFASISPFAYVDAMRGHKIHLLAQSAIYGSAWYRGVIIARKDSGLKTLADLRGKRFAFVDPMSASGYVYPRAMLIDQGFDPDHFFAATSFAGDHEKVIAAIIGHESDAGAVYDKALDRQAGVPVDDLTIIARTDPIPFDAIVASIALDPALAARIQSALVDLEHSEAGRKVIAQSRKGLTGFAAASDGIFNGVRRTAGAAGL